MKVKFCVLIPLMACFLTHCTKDSVGPKTPKEALSSYISSSFSLSDYEDRKKLEPFLTGEAKARLLQWNQEEFKKEIVQGNRKFISLAIKEVKKISEQETALTYELTYSSGSAEKEAKITTLRLASFVFENSTWLIRDVRNLKELIEYKNEFSIP